MKLADIAQALDARLEGDGTLELLRAVHPSEVQGPQDLALAMDKDLVEGLIGSPAVAAVLAEGTPVPDGLAGAILVNRPRYAMAGLLDIFEKPVHAEPGIHAQAFVAPDAEIGEGVSIAPFAYVGPKASIGAGTIIMPHATIGAEARIGANCLIHPGARIGERVEMGQRCIIHPNAAVGNDGFSFVTPERGSVETARSTGRVQGFNTLLRRVNSIGTVVLGDDVEVGAGTTIDRGTVTATRIGSGTKLDNLVQIGHNGVIGTNCMLCGQSGIAGSVVLGDRVVLAGKVGIGDHLTVGDDAVIAGNSAVGCDVPAKEVYFGYPARPRGEAFELLRNLGRLKRLFTEVADLRKRLRAVEKPGAPPESEP